VTDTGKQTPTGSKAGHAVSLPEKAPQAWPFWDGGARKASVMGCFSRVSLARKKCWPEFATVAG